MHDPCARCRCLRERTTQKHLQKAPVWSRPNTLRSLSQKCFYNSRMLERSQLRVPFYEDVGAFFIVVRSCLLSLQSKSFPCRASRILAEQVSSLQSKFHPCRASFLKLGEQVWAFVLSGAHTEDGLYLLWACKHGPVDMGLLGSPSLITYFILFILYFQSLMNRARHVQDKSFNRAPQVFS